MLTNVRTSGDWIVSMIPDKNNVPIWNYEIVLEWWSHALDDVRELLADSDVIVNKIQINKPDNKLNQNEEDMFNN